MISEIMQATTIQNLKRAKGLDTSESSILLAMDNAHYYKTQLTCHHLLLQMVVKSVHVPDRVNVFCLYIDKESAPKGTTKGDLLRARNLNRYINQVLLYYMYSVDQLLLNRFSISGIMMYRFSFISLYSNCGLIDMGYMSSISL